MGIINHLKSVLSKEYWISTVKTEEKASKLDQILIESQGGTDIAIKENYVKISRESYRMNPYAYRAVKLIADSVSELDFVLYRTVKGQLREVDKSPYLDLLNNPNEMQGKGEFLREYFSTLLLSGEGFIEGVYGGGKPQFLYTRRPDRMSLDLGNYKQVIENYVYEVNGRERKVKEKEMSFIKYFNPIDDWRGMSPITAASLSIDLSNEWKKWNVGFLLNGARPSLAIKLQQDMSLTPEKKAELREDFIQKNTGAYNAGKPLILTGGAEATAVGSSPSDMDGIEGQRLTANEVGLIYGVPPTLMGDTSASTDNNVESDEKKFIRGTVFPVFQMLIDELNRWLTPLYGENLTLSFDRDIPSLSKDIKEVAEIYGKAWELGAITRNEYRKKLQLDEIESGDVFKTKMQDIFVEAGNEGVQKQLEQIPEKKGIDFVLKKIDRYIEIKATSEENILKVTESIDPEEIYDDVIPAYTLEVAEVGAGALLGLDDTFSFDAFSTNTEKYLKEEVGKKITLISDTLREKVRKAIEDGVKDDIGFFNIKENIKKIYEDQYFLETDSHLQTIVRTETMDALNFASDEAFKQSGVVTAKEWITTIDGRERDSHSELNLKVVGINEKFIVPSNGHSTLRPHAFGIADEDINCRCVNSPVVGEKTLFADLDKKQEYWIQKDLEAQGYEPMFNKAYKKAFKKQEKNTLKALDNIEV